MKTTFILIFFSLLAFSNLSFAQKIKIKKGIVTVDKIKYVKIETEHYGNDISVYDLNGNNELVFIKYMSSNNENTNSYFIVRFIDFKKEAEVRAISKKGILKKLYKANVIIENNIDEINMEKFVSKYGSDESKNKYLINNN